MNEELLEAWLRLSTILCNDRIVSEMPYNEALICNILHRRQRLDKNGTTTATDLCRQTRNRTGKGSGGGLERAWLGMGFSAGVTNQISLMK